MKKYSKKKFVKARKFVKKSYKKRSNVRNDTLIYKGVGLPSQFFTKLKYSEDINLTSGTPVFAYQSSCYKPNYSASGHQPMYYDQLCSSLGPYLRYQVLGMKAYVEFVNTANTVAYVGVVWSDANSTSDLSTLMEQKFSMRRTLGPLTGTPTAVVKTYMSAKKIHGQGKEVAVENQWGGYNTSPSDPFFLILAASDITNLSTIAVSFRITLTYYVRFFERAVEAQS